VSDAARAVDGDRVAVLILAAGASSRMGRSKPLLELDGKTLLQRAAETALASRCRPVIVVLGSEAAQTRRALGGLPVEVVVNAEWKRGLSSSIRAGLAALEVSAEPVRAALIMLCDQPFVTSALIDQLVARYESSTATIVACEYADRVGAPALFDRTLFPELEKLSGDRGARPLLERDPERVARVHVPEAAFDIDTPEDYAKLRRHLENP
jgi:molybdenum cofactor cytidylyltransferase